jgi:hypothetical protein
MINKIRLDEEGINIKATLCLTFAAFLRSGEFTWDIWSKQYHRSHLSRKHVFFSTNSIILTLPASKTNPFRRSVDIHLASSQSPLCPIAALTQLFNTYPCSPLQPLFTRPHGQSFIKQFLLSTIHHLLLQVNIPIADFSDHSIRKEAAVTAAANGISRENIQLLGRWKSDAIDLYINEIHESEHIQKLLQFNSQLLNFTPFYS